MTTVGTQVPLPTRLSKHQAHEVIIEQIDDIFPSVEDLTLEEKLSLLSGIDFSNTNGIPRLGLPPLKVSILQETVSFIYLLVE